MRTFPSGHVECPHCVTDPATLPRDYLDPIYDCDRCPKQTACLTMLRIHKKVAHDNRRPKMRVAFNAKEFYAVAKVKDSARTG